MVEVLSIGGEPATGKSTLMRNVLNKLGPCQPFEYGVLKGTMYPDDNVFVLGRYEADSFDGTDKLAMNVQPVAEEFVENCQNHDEYTDWTILYEGDRLFNKSFIQHCRQTTDKTRVYVLTATKNTLDKRHKQRGDTQNKEWLKGRKTKNAAIASKHYTETLPNNTVKQMRENVQKILDDFTP